jgi:cysteine desulfurase
VGLGVACEIAQKEMVKRSRHTKRLKKKAKKGIGNIEEVVFNGHPRKSLPYILNFCVKYVEGESMLMMLNDAGIACASGSACTSKALKASHVLLGIGISPDVAQGSILLSFGVENTEEEVDKYLEIFPKIVKRLRAISPLGKR